MVDGNDPHWNAELFGAEVVADQTYRRVKCVCKHEQQDHSS